MEEGREELEREGMGGRGRGGASAEVPPKHAANLPP